MKCLGILSAILTDIGLQFRGDIIPKLPTATVERLSWAQSHPMNHVKRRNQMLWGDIATCDEMQPIPCSAFIFYVVEIQLPASEQTLISTLAEVKCLFCCLIA